MKPYRVLWTRILNWPLLGQQALAEVHWSSRRTGGYSAEALSYWRLTTNTEVEEDLLVDVLGRRNFFHPLCAAEDYQVDVLYWPRKPCWHQFQSGIFQGSLFVETLESESEEETF